MELFSVDAGWILSHNEVSVSWAILNATASRCTISFNSFVGNSSNSISNVKGFSAIGSSYVRNRKWEEIGNKNRKYLPQDRSKGQDTCVPVRRRRRPASRGRNSEVCRANQDRCYRPLETTWARQPRLKKTVKMTKNIALQKLFVLYLVALRQTGQKRSRLDVPYEFRLIFSRTPKNLNIYIYINLFIRIRLLL